MKIVEGTVDQFQSLGGKRRGMVDDFADLLGTCLGGVKQFIGTNDGVSQGVIICRF